MKMPLKTIASVALLMLPALSFALGLGDINVNSKLNEPLRAEIRLLYSDADEIESTQIALASPEDFERVGLDSSTIPFDLNFVVQRNEDGDFVVVVTSELPISEPFLDFLVEVNWANGRLLREYVVLLDPPVIAPASGPAVTGISQQPTPAPTPTTSPSYPDDDDQPAAVSTTGSQPTSYPSSDTYGPVASGDTLWEISRDWRPGGDISINQMMVMLHQMNPDAFYRDNINALKRGAILRMPSAEDFNSLNQTAATRNVKNQNEMWESYRLTAATRTPTVSDAGVSPEYDSGVSPSSSDDSRLELVPPSGDAGSDVDYGEGSYALQEEVSDLRTDLQRTREDLLSATQENSELTSRVNDLEDLVSNLETAITLKDADLADLQIELEMAREGLTSLNREVDSGYDYDTGSDATTADAGFDDTGYDDADDSYADAGTGFDDSSTDPITTAVDDANPGNDTSLDSGTNDTIPDTADVAVTTPPPVVTTPPPARESKSMVMALMTNPFVIGGLAVIFLGLGAFVWQRRRQAAAGESLIDAMMEEEYAAPEPIPMPTPPTEPEPEPEAFAATVASPMMSEDSLINAIQTNPSDPQAHLALLRMYYSEGEKDKFTGAAQKMHEHIGGTSHPAWAEVKGMGSTLAPEHALFGGSGGSADDDDSPGLDLQGSSVADSDDDDEFSLDLDLGDDSGESSADAGLDLSMDSDDDSDDEFSLDLDMDDSDGSTDDAGDDDDDLNLDFDSVSADDDQEDAELPTDTAEELEGLDFDLDAADMPDAEESKVGDHTEFELEAVSDGEDSSDMETPDASDDDDLGLGDIDFDMDLDSGDEAAPEADSAGDSELDALAQTDISDLGLDDLDLDEETLSGSEDSVGTKLDLARAYIEMGDPDGARGMLDEVVTEGSEEQVEEAQKLLSDLG